MSDAVGDIVYLGQRLKGIIELSDKLSTQEALENQITELTATVEKIKADIETANQLLADSKDAVKLVLEEAKTQAKKITDDASDFYSKTKTEAMGVNEAARMSVIQIMKDRDAALTQLDSQIKDKTDELATVTSQVDAALAKLNNAQQELSNLRNKL